MLATLEIASALAAPFGSHAIRFRAGATSGNRAMALAYVTAAAVCDRLDAVMGIAGWRDHYLALDNGCVRCTLELFLESNWIAKEDVGAPSEQPDAGDRCKSAFSDALKRAAAKWGIGRYLHSLPPLWLDYDQKAKRFVKEPVLPATQQRQATTPATRAAATRELAQSA